MNMKICREVLGKGCLVFIRVRVWDTAVKYTFKCLIIKSRASSRDPSLQIPTQTVLLLGLVHLDGNRPLQLLIPFERTTVWYANALEIQLYSDFDSCSASSLEGTDG